MNKKQFYSLLKSVPKAEIHLHSEAVMTRKTIRRLYKSCQGAAMTTERMNKLFSYEDLNGFINAFLTVQSYISSADDLKIVFDDIRTYLEDNNIVYAELFFAPSSFLKRGYDFHTMISRISESISNIEKNDKRTMRLLIDVSRTFGEENAMNNLNLTIKENSPYILGIGLGGAESKGPAKDFERVFAKARKAGLHVVAHAGEDVESWSIKDALHLLKAERIGHGITAAQDPELVKEMAKDQIPFEICPTSNTFTKKVVSRIQDHPIRQLYDQGCFVTVNTDDPAFFKVSLIDEYWNLYSKLHFTAEDIRKIIINGFKAAFISDSAKKKYTTSVNKAWKEWFAANPEVTE